MMILDIIYFAIFAVVSYLTFFHLILWVENKDKIVKKIKSGKLPSVSILVPAFNEENSIEDTIKNLLKINYPKNNLEIIVIDDGSTDRTYEITKKYEDKIKILRKENSGKASALNFGLDHAKNEFVAVVDADTLLEKNALRNCMKCFEEQNIVAVTSHILTKQKNKLIEKLQSIELMIIALTRKLKEELNLIDVTPGPLSVYRKKMLVDLGKFDENNLVEDVEIAWRILRNGYKIKMAYDAMVYSKYPSSLGKWWAQRTRWSIGGLQTLFKYLGCIFKKDANVVRTFLVPVSIIDYVFTIIGAAIFFYLAVNFLINNSLYLIKTIFMGVRSFYVNMNYSLDVFSVYGTILFISSLLLIKASLSNHKEKSSISSLIVFPLYLFLYRFVCIYSIYKFIKRERGWLTK